VEQFDTLLEAQVVIEDWRIDYNWHRPHSALDMLAPADYAARQDPPETLIAHGPTTGVRPPAP
jgi:hypothetical protein